MATHPQPDLAAMMAPAALSILGEPNEKRRGGNEWRYGTHGSLKIDIEKGTYFDFEKNEGGGVLAFLKDRLGLSEGRALAWLCRINGQSLPTRPKKTEAAAKTIVKTYPYRDETGTLLFEVVRYAPKDFRQRRPGEDGEWIWRLDNVRRVLYRLQETIAAAEKGGLVFIVEGEKDADRLCSLGFVATTAPGGSRKWLPQYNAALRGADVVVLHDTDEAGRAHAKQVVDSLTGTARRIRLFDIAKHWPQCPEKGDVSGWLDAGDEANKLHLLLEPERPEWQRATFSAADLQGMTFPPVSWILKDVIPAEGSTMLCSKPKFGKSWLAYDLCIACTTNRMTLGDYRTAQGDVLYLALEDSKRRLQRRMAKLLPDPSASWPKKLTITTNWRRMHEGGLDDIRAWHELVKNRGGNPIMAVIDVLAKVRKPHGNKPAYDADYEALGGLHGLANELGFAAVVIHHTRKMAADDLMETVSGTYGLTGVIDTVLVMATKPNGGAVLDIRGRDVEPAELAIMFNKDSCRWTVLGAAAEIHVSQQRAKIISALKGGSKPMTIADLMEATDMKRDALKVLLGKMVGDQLIQRVDTGLYAENSFVPPQPPPTPRGHKSNRSNGGNHTAVTPAPNTQDAESTKQNVDNDAESNRVTEVTAESRTVVAPITAALNSVLACENPVTPVTAVTPPTQADDPVEVFVCERSNHRKVTPVTPVTVCAQCGGSAATGNGVPTLTMDSSAGVIWLHTECQRYWSPTQSVERGGLIIGSSIN